MPAIDRSLSDCRYTADSWERLRAPGSSGVGQRALARSASRSSGAAAGTPLTASSGEGAPVEVVMTEEGRVALMGAVRRIATIEGGDRFDSLSLRDIRLQLPAALAAVTAGAAGAQIVDGDTALNRIAAGSGQGDKELRRVVIAVQEAAATGLERISSSGGNAGTRYRCCNKVGVTVANCNINANFLLNFLLKMQIKWRIAPENDDVLLKNGRLFCKSRYPSSTTLQTPTSLP